MKIALFVELNFSKIIYGFEVIGMETIFFSQNEQSPRVSLRLEYIVGLSDIVVSKFLSSSKYLKGVGVYIIFFPVILISIDFIHWKFRPFTSLTQRNRYSPVAQLYMIPNDRILIIKILILWNHQIQTYLIHVPFIIHYLVAVLYSRLNKSVMLTLLPKNLALIRRLVKTDKILILELARQIVLQNQCASPDIFIIPCQSQSFSNLPTT